MLRLRDVIMALDDKQKIECLPAQDYRPPVSAVELEELIRGRR